MEDCFITRNRITGFWINEPFVQLLMHYIYIEAQKTKYIFSNKQALLEDMEDCINGLCRGYVGFTWEEYEFNGGTDEQTMVEVLQNIETNLQSKGSFISINELQAIPTQDNIFKWLFRVKPFPIAELMKIIDAFIQVLQGTWISTNYDMTAEINWTYSD